MCTSALRMTGAFLLVTCLGLAGCTSEFCSRHSDCAPGTECGTVGVCVLILPEPDADNTCPDCDASLLDASPLDASPLDASPLDATPPADATPPGDATFTDAMPEADASFEPGVDASGLELPVLGKGADLVGVREYHGL